MQPVLSARKGKENKNQSYSERRKISFPLRGKTIEVQQVLGSPEQQLT